MKVKELIEQLKEYEDFDVYLPYHEEAKSVEFDEDKNEVEIRY